jgi:imidazolonepropionase-like amidohydrolase
LTAIHLVNAPTNVIAGQTAWLRLGDLGASSVGHRQAAAEQWSLSAVARNEERYPATLVGQAAMVRNRLAGQLLETTLYLPESAVRKLLLQKVAVLDSVQSGTLPVFIDARTDAEIDAAIRLVTGTQVQAWLCAPNQLRPFVKLLAENRVGVVVPATNEQTYGWYFADLVEAHRAGVRLLIGGQSGEALRVTVAALVNAGLDPAAGRRLLTMDTESTLAKSENIGLTVGADADWLVWSDDPVSLSSELLWHSSGEQP